MPTSSVTRSAPPSRTRAPRKDAAENRLALLDAAALVLNNDPDAPLEAIAAAAGLSRRAVYGHFANRDELMIALLDRGARRVGAALEPVSHPDARVEIALFGATLWAEVSHVRVMAELAVRGPHGQAVAEALAPARARLLVTVRRGIADGTIRDDMDAATTTALIEGAALSVLDEATRTGLDVAQGHRLVILNALSAAGLGWRETARLLQQTPELDDIRPRALDTRDDGEASE